jgi:AmmeMemoRadiSam system protein A
MITDRGQTLLAIARGAIATQLDIPSPSVDDTDWQREPGATFVTLTCAGALRGCIGSLMAERPLRADVENNALAAAFSDPRFTPLSEREYGDIDVEVSLLSPMQPFAVEDEKQALTLLRPGIDGVLLEYGWRRGTFLPQVWDQLPEPRAFLAHLKQKAGLPADFWAEEIRLSRYTVTKWHETKIQHEHT